MFEFLQEIISPMNLPVTMLLGLVMLYWVMVIVGVIGMDAFDIDVGGDLDIDLDADVDVDGSIFGDVLGFLYLADVPVMIVGTIFTIWLWIGTIFSNHYFNPQLSFWVALLWMGVHFFVSLVITKFTLMPMVSLFKTQHEHKHEDMLGMSGVVTTTEVTDRFGRIEIHIDGPPVTVNVRCRAGTSLAQGDLAKILAYDESSNTFLVELSKWEKE